MNIQSKDSVLTLANAIELTAAIVSNVAGNDIGNSVNGQQLSSNDLRNIVSIRVQSHFSNNLRVSA